MIISLIEWVSLPLPHPATSKINHCHRPETPTFGNSARQEGLINITEMARRALLPERAQRNPSQATVDALKSQRHHVIDAHAITSGVLYSEPYATAPTREPDVDVPCGFGRIYSAESKSSKLAIAPTKTTILNALKSPCPLL
jgi:hypothetical protein